MKKTHDHIYPEHMDENQRVEELKRAVNSVEKARRIAKGCGLTGEALIEKTNKIASEELGYNVFERFDLKSKKKS